MHLQSQSTFTNFAFIMKIHTLLPKPKSAIPLAIKSLPSLPIIYCCDQNINHLDISKRKMNVLKLSELDHKAVSIQC